jgi:hypothetical protein
MFTEISYSLELVLYQSLKGTRALFEKLVVVQLVRKFPAFHGM